MGAPGQLFRLAPAALPAHVSAYSSHALGLNHLFDTLPISLGNNAVPTIEIIGAEIGRIQPFSQTLSPEVAGAVKPAVALVRTACSLASSKIATGHGGKTTHGATTTSVTRL
jgi:hydrogenase maturation protease